MTQKTVSTSPFGLSISIGIAMKMLKDGKVAPSIVLANLFALQSSTSFPKELDEHFFENNQHRTNDAEKKVILAIMEEMKKPNTDTKKMLTDFFTPIWVKKIPPVVTNKVPANKTMGRNTTKLNGKGNTQKNTAKPMVKK